MTSSYYHHEKYRSEYSMDIAVACDITPSCIRAVFYDRSLSRRVARSVSVFAGVTAENAAAELVKFVFIAMREHGIPSSAITSIGCCAPIDIASAVEEELSPTDMFLRPDVEITVLPFVSAYADGRFAATLVTVPMQDGTFIADFGSTLNMAYYTGGKLEIASFVLAGAFDGSAFEDGIPCEFGAIDELSCEDNSTICYTVSGDQDSCGVAASAALDGVKIMLDRGIIDEDGIMTDRDLFYIGEDYYISQKDVRAVQSDKAKAAAAISCFLRRYAPPTEVFLTGDVTANRGVQRLAELGIMSSELVEKAHFSPIFAEQGVIICLSDSSKYEALNKLINAAADVSNDILDGFDDLYITNLSFSVILSEKSQKTT